MPTWGSTYTNGGQNAEYQWGVPSLNGQINGLGGNVQGSFRGNFDPTTMINIMRNDDWRLATWQREQELADRAYYERKAREAANRNQGGSPGGWAGGGPPPLSAMDRAVQEAQAKAALAQARALYDPSPMKTVTSIGGGVQYIPDTEHFTGAQRMVFGPNNAGFDNAGPSRMEVGGRTSDAVWGSRLAEQQEKTPQAAPYDTYGEGMRMYAPSAYAAYLEDERRRRQGR